MRRPETTNAAATLLRYDVTTDPFSLQASPSSIEIAGISSSVGIVAEGVIEFAATEGEIQVVETEVEAEDVPADNSARLVDAAGATYTIEYSAGGEVVNVPAEGEPPLGSSGQ